MLLVPDFPSHDHGIYWPSRLTVLVVNLGLHSSWIAGFNSRRLKAANGISCCAMDFGPSEVFAFQLCFRALFAATTKWHASSIRCCRMPITMWGFESTPQPSTFTGQLWVCRTNAAFTLHAATLLRWCIYTCCCCVNTCTISIISSFCSAIHITGHNDDITANCVK